MMGGLLYFIWLGSQLIIGFNLIFPSLLTLLHSILPRKKRKTSQLDLDYAVIITAYQYIDTLPSVIESALELNYNKYHIYVVLDNCEDSLNFSNEKVTILKPEQILRGNVKSHFYAINRFIRHHDVLTIIDSDNIIDPDYLLRLNTYFSAGYKAVQGVREAKNLDSMYACLDAARDVYYHYYDCKLLFNCGSSATLSGSGMAFDVNLYKDCLENLHVEGAGFDKVLQAQIVKRNYRIAFCEEAIVYDQKTTMPDQLVNQRSRWINTWFKYFKLGFSLIARGLKSLSINQLLFGLVLLRPPLFIFLLLSIIMLCLNLVVAPVAAVYWGIALTLFVATFLLALLNSPTDKRIYRSLVGIPNFIFYQLISLTKVTRANERSVSTKHNHP